MREIWLCIDDGVAFSTAVADGAFLHEWIQTILVLVQVNHFVEVDHRRHDDIDVGELGLTHLEEYDSCQRTGRKQDCYEGRDEEYCGNANFIRERLLHLRLNHALKDRHQSVASAGRR